MCCFVTTPSYFSSSHFASSYFAPFNFASSDFAPFYFAPSYFSPSHCAPLISPPPIFPLPIVPLLFRPFKIQAPISDKCCLNELICLAAVRRTFNLSGRTGGGVILKLQGEQVFGIARCLELRQPTLELNSVSRFFRSRYKKTKQLLLYFYGWMRISAMQANFNKI